MKTGQGVVTKAYVRHNDACRNILGEPVPLTENGSVQSDAITSEVVEEIRKLADKGYDTSMITTMVKTHILELPDGQRLGQQAERKVNY